VPLAAGLRFSFAGLELEPGAINRFRFEVIDPQGRVLATVGREIVQEAVRREIVGQALSTAVLAKPIVLDATDGDRLVRQTLLAEGAALPAVGRFSFSVADPTGLVRLPIYQGNRTIKELRASVGPVAVGTPIEVEIRCDELTRIVVLFTVGGQSFGGAIEPPPPDEVPTERAVEETDDEFGAALERLDPADAGPLRDEYATARRDLAEARAGSDDPKVIQRAADLRTLLERAKLVEPLSPALRGRGAVRPVPPAVPRGGGRPPAARVLVAEGGPGIRPRPDPRGVGEAGPGGVRGRRGGAPRGRPVPRGRDPNEGRRGRASAPRASDAPPIQSG
jgi:hypothetical protein